ncbi:MAG: InlB B-repeat-containing protein [Acholeplasmatales bacterium]|nr:InlB B-repeat-containing protein [Acholeplasmatales bacterium]
MKKKRILLGLTLAGAALFALASCKGGNDKKSEEATSQATSQAATSEATSQAATSEATSQESTQATVKFGAKFLDGTAAKYYDDLQVVIDKGGKVSKPATDPSEEGYTFLGYYTSATLATKFDFENTTITANKTIYCAFDKNTAYHEKVAAATEGQYCVMEDFNSGKALTKAEFGDAAGIFDQSADGGKVDMANFAAVVTGDGNAIRGTLGIGFGGVQTTSTIKGYLELNMASFKQDIFFGVIGAKKTATEKFDEGADYKIMNFGTASDGSSRIKYDDEATQVSIPDTKLAAGTNYVMEYEIDTVAKKIKLSVDGVAVKLSDAEDKSFDYSAIDVTGVKGIQITSLGYAINISVNNVLVEINENDATEAKANAIAAVKAYASNAKYDYAKDAVDAIIDEYTNETNGKLVNATTITEIATLSTEANDKFLAAIANKTITIHYMSAANTAMQKDGADYTATTSNFELGYTVLKGDVTPEGYVAGDLYADSALTTALPVLNDQITDIYVVLTTASNVEKTVTIKNIKKADATDLDKANDWYGTGSYKESQADGKSGEASTPTTGNYECYQIAISEQKNADGNSYSPKQYKDPTYLYSSNFADETTSVTINMTGFTGGSSSASKYVKAVAYDADGNAIGSVDIYTSKLKANGSFTSDGESETDIVLSASANISYVRFECTTEGKSVFITSVKLIYAKAN